MNESNNVAKVIEGGTCLFCGGCYAVCTSDAISLTYDGDAGFFRVNLDCAKCISCTRCTQVCPAIHFMESPTDHKSGVEAVIGVSLDQFLAFSCDNRTRSDSSSGGVAGTLMRFLLDEKIVDAAVLVRAKHDEPFAGSVVIRDAEPLEKEPREYASRYVSVPVLACMKEISASRIGIVCVPCQAYAARKVCDILKIDALIVGIACSGGTSARATLQVLREIGIVRPRRLYYRGGGWPGKFSMEGLTAEGEEIRFEEHFPSSRFVEVLNSFLWRNPACWRCNDHFAEEADVSFFDFWNEEFIRSESMGQTGVIIRSQSMLSLFGTLTDKRYVSLGSKLMPKEIIESQSRSVQLKKERFASDSRPNVWSRILELVVRSHAILGLYRHQHSGMSIRLWSRLFGFLIHMSRYDMHEPKSRDGERRG